MSMGELIIDGGEVVAALSKSEIDMQIATARAFPRDLPACIAQATQIATRNVDTAISMFYCLPRADKDIEGPSIRLAEVVAYCWTNMRVESRIVSVDHKFVTAQGTAFDIERNVAARGECKRRITYKNGSRFSDDMIQTTANAACAIALREAIFKVVPRFIVNEIMDKAKRASVGEANELGMNIQKCLDHFQKIGVSPDVIFNWLGVETQQEITAEHLVKLRGTWTAIKDGEVTKDEAFNLEPSKPEKKVSASKVSKPAKGELFEDGPQDAVEQGM